MYVNTLCVWCLHVLYDAYVNFFNSNSVLYSYVDVKLFTYKFEHEFCYLGNVRKKYIFNFLKI